MSDGDDSTVRRPRAVPHRVSLDRLPPCGQHDCDDHRVQFLEKALRSCSRSHCTTDKLILMLANRALSDPCSEYAAMLCIGMSEQLGCQPPRACESSVWTPRSVGSTSSYLLAAEKRPHRCTLTHLQEQNLDANDERCHCRAPAPQSYTVQDVHLQGPNSICASWQHTVASDHTQYTDPIYGSPPGVATYDSAADDEFLQRLRIDSLSASSTMTGNTTTASDSEALIEVDNMSLMPMNIDFSHEQLQDIDWSSSLHPDSNLVPDLGPGYIGDEYLGTVPSNEIADSRSMTGSYTVMSPQANVAPTAVINSISDADFSVVQQDIVTSDNGGSPDNSREASPSSVVRDFEAENDTSTESVFRGL